MSDREVCVVCGGQSLESLCVYKKFPTLMTCTTQVGSKDIFMDMAWDICMSCGGIQLRSLVPLEHLYSENHNDAVGKTWFDHNQAFSSFVSRFQPQNVMEIGGGSGKIAKEALRSKANAISSWVILEPNPIVDIEDSRLSVIKGWTSDLTAAECSKFDTLVHSHVMEHFYSPTVEIDSFSHLFPPGHKVIFSVPNLRHWLQKKFLNALMFEHSYLLDEDSINYLMAQGGYELVAREDFRDHSQFYCYVRSHSSVRILAPTNFAKNKILFNSYQDYARSESLAIAKAIEELPGESSIYLFGAHIFAQILLHLGVPEPALGGILDNSEAKQGKRLYGHSLMVKSPECIRNERLPAVILRAGAYNSEIEKQLKEINPSVRIV